MRAYLMFALRRSAVLFFLLLSAGACENFVLKKVGRDSPPASLDAGSPSGTNSSPPLKTEDSAPAGKKGNPNPLLAAIEAQLRTVKPDIGNTRLVSLLPGLDWGDTMTYVVIAMGRGTHRGWKQLQDIGEIYGVFWVDSTLTRPSAPIDVFPTRRLGDYDVWLQRAWGDSVIVCAEGTTYADEPMRRAIVTKPHPGQPRVIQVDTSGPRRPGNGVPCGRTGPKGGD